MDQCKQLIEELKEQLQVSVQGEGKMRRMAEESQTELQEWKGRHQLLTEQVGSFRVLLDMLEVLYYYTVFFGETC